MQTQDNNSKKTNSQSCLSAVSGSLKQKKCIFKLGQKVKWSSKSGGWEKEKEGIIVAVVRKNEYGLLVARTINPGNIAKSRKHKEAQDWGAYPRNHESYLVLVDGKTAKSKQTIYWPRASSLSLSNDR